MTLTKKNLRLEETRFLFDEETGEVSDLILVVSYEIHDDGIHIDTIRQDVSKWGDLTSTQRTQASAVGKNLRQLAETI